MCPYLHTQYRASVWVPFAKWGIVALLPLARPKPNTTARHLPPHLSQAMAQSFLTPILTLTPQDPA